MFIEIEADEEEVVIRINRKFNLSIIKETALKEEDTVYKFVGFGKLEEPDLEKSLKRFCKELFDYV